VAESAEEAAEAFVSDDGGYERERWSQAAETAAVASGRGGAGSDRQQGCFGGSWIVVDVSRSATASAARHIHPCPVAPPPSRHPCPVAPSLQSTLPRGGGASCGAVASVATTTAASSSTDCDASDARVHQRR
jgi:hypothetical protein